MKICAVIVTHNSRDVVLKCIESLLENNVDKILVVDSASTDKSLDLIRQKFPAVEIEKNNTNLGYARGNNYGFEYVLRHGFDFALVVNPDVIFEKNAVNTLLKAAALVGQKYIVGPKIVQAKNPKKIWSAGGILDQNRHTAKLIGFNESSDEYSTSREVLFISGTCMLIPAKLLQKGLRFHEQYFMYYEDVEFCLRAKMLGFPSFYVHSSVLHHAETSENDKPKTAKEYYLARNHLLFVERNAPFRVKLRECIRFPKTLLDHYRAKNYSALKGIIDYVFRKFGAQTEK